MTIDVCEVSNLEELHEYIQKKNDNVSAIEGRSYLSVYKRFEVTFELSELSMIECCILSNIADSIKIIESKNVTTDQTLLKTYNLDQDYYDELLNMNNFSLVLHNTEDKIDISNTLPMMSYTYKVIVSINGESLLPMLGIGIDTIFKTNIDNQVTSLDYTVPDNLEKIKDNICMMFANEFYKLVNNELQTKDSNARFINNKNYYSTTDDTCSLIRLVGPYGSVIKFVTNEQPNNITDDMGKIIKSIKEGLTSSIRLYFNCNATIKTYFYLKVLCQLDIISESLFDLIFSSSDYKFDDSIDSKYEKRINHFFSPLVQQKIFAFNQQEYSKLFKILFTPVNITISFMIDISLSENDINKIDNLLSTLSQDDNIDHEVIEVLKSIRNAMSVIYH